MSNSKCIKIPRFSRGPFVYKIFKVNFLQDQQFTIYLTIKNL